jgi:two-component system OmpR family response regulator
MKKLGNESASASGPKPRLLPKERLLYVEDDDDNFRVAELRLRDGYELVRASDSVQACRLVQAGGWSAILMDIELRGSDLDGVELTKLLRGRLRKESLPAYARVVQGVDTPIIFVTAHGAKYSEAALLLLGAEKVITKPVDFGALNLALTQLHLTRVRQKGRSPV